jgi:LysM repeat protein
MSGKRTVDVGVVAAAWVALAMAQGCRTAQAPTVVPQPAAQPAELVAPTPPPPLTCVEPAKGENALLKAEETSKPLPPPPPAPATKIYKIGKGDTVSAIAASHGIKIAEVMALNPGLNANKIVVGREIRLPAHAKAKPMPPKPAKARKAAKAGKADASGNYVVKAGDTLGAIAHANGTTSKAIMEANNLSSDRLKIGQKLAMPGKDDTPAPAPSTLPDATAPAVPAALPPAEAAIPAPPVAPAPVTPPAPAP